ncbi:MAG: hypothetical protein A3B89_01610 [Candidatus Buchananbacteria bacterium RIFCSPHIGHO2_02_FULL_40_13]|nr:MAG: hypothetical protein A3B89_01610 [Candidatus Buchananbacteria bacterium RIFCSPHIGHO2_02_FULL_40_13]
MPAKILNGQELADNLKSDLAKKIFAMDKKPGLAAVLVGDNEASATYIKLKAKACLAVGINFHKYLCPQDIGQEKLIDLIDFLNADQDVDGILLQLPLPDDYQTQTILDVISRNKDVDGFFSNGEKDKVVPPTIAAITELLKATKEDLKNKKTLVIAKCDIYTDKMKKYLADLNIDDIATNSDIPADANNYDIIIIALGQAQSLKKEMVKDGAIVIDVGINKIDGRVVGDVDGGVKDKAAFVSPVPGGVGPLTVAGLLKNVYELAAKKQSA